MDNFFLLATVLLFAIISYKKPLWALGLVLALAPTYLIRFVFFSVPVTFFEILIVVFVAMVTFKHFGREARKKIIRLGSLNIWIAVFLLAAGIGVVVSPEKLKALGMLKAFFLEPVLFFYAMVILTDDAKKLIIPLKYLFVSSTAIAAFGITQYYTMFLLPLRFWGYGPEMRRVVSVFEYPNALALYLAPIIALFLMLALQKQWLFSKKTTIFFISVQVIALFLTFSRGAWIALAAILLAYLFKTGVKKFASAFILILTLTIVVSPVRQRLNFNDLSNNSRIQLMSAGLKKAAENPIFGNGLYGFRTTLLEQNFKGEVLNFPHNIFLNFWLETGLAGLISFFAVVFIALNKGLKTGSVYAYSFIAFVGVVLLHGLVDVSYFKNDLSLLFWFVIGALSLKT
jgi:O-antigen ligase